MKREILVENISSAGIEVFRYVKENNYEIPSVVKLDHNNTYIVVEDKEDIKTSLGNNCIEFIEYSNAYKIIIPVFFKVTGEIEYFINGIINK